MGTSNPFLTFYRSKWFKDARHESPSWRDCVACWINVSMRRSRTWGRLSGLVNTLKNSCIDSLWVFGKSCVLHFPVGVFGDENMGLSLPFCFPPTCLPATLNLQSSTIPARSAASYLPSALYIHRWAIKGWDGSPRSRRHCLFTQNREKSGMQSRCALQNWAFFSLVWVKKRGLWRAGSSDKVGDVKEVVRGRGKQQDTILWEAAKGDDC